jgi:hypothetical protein
MQLKYDETTDAVDADFRRAPVARTERVTRRNPAR